MKEGAWISAPTGRSAWVDDHAMWVTRAGNAGLLGVSEDAQRRLVAMPSPHTPAGRREVLLAAMDAGLIRVRGHGVTTTFEFTMPFPDMLQAVRPFMQEHFGPFMGCRFNNLQTGEVMGLLFKDLVGPFARVQSAANGCEPPLIENLPAIGWETPCWCGVPSWSVGPGDEETPMSKIQYTVEVEHLPEGVCPEVVEECEGTRYRAIVLRGNAKIVHAMMLEPFVEAFSYELPLFVLGMTHLRLVMDGKVTPEGEKMIIQKMKTLLRATRTTRDSPHSEEP